MLISLDTAKAHVRAVQGTAEDAILTLYIGAAELSVAEYLNRRIYADQTALDTAIAAVPAAFVTATANNTAALAAAALLTDQSQKDAATDAAQAAYRDFQNTALEIWRGIVINPAIQAAILLKLGDLYDSREDTVIDSRVAVVPLPQGSRSLLQPYRVGVGI